MKAKRQFSKTIRPARVSRKRKTNKPVQKETVYRKLASILDKPKEIGSWFKQHCNTMTTGILRGFLTVMTFYGTLIVLARLAPKFVTLVEKDIHKTMDALVGMKDSFKTRMLGDVIRTTILSPEKSMYAISWFNFIKPNFSKRDESYAQMDVRSIRNLDTFLEDDWYKNTKEVATAWVYLKIIQKLAYELRNKDRRLNTASPRYVSALERRLQELHRRVSDSWLLPIPELE